MSDAVSRSRGRGIQISIYLPLLGLTGSLAKFPIKSVGLMLWRRDLALVAAFNYMATLKNDLKIVQVKLSQMRLVQL